MSLSKYFHTSLLSVVLLTWSVFAAEFGYPTIYTSASSTTNRRAHQFTMPENGIITSVSVYHNNPTTIGQMQLGVYADNGSNMPGSRQSGTVKTTVAAAAAWQTIALAKPCTVSAGTKVWLAFMYQYNSGQRYGSVSGASYASVSATWSTSGDNMPATFGTATTSSGYAYSIKAIYTPTGSSYTLNVTASNGTVTKNPDLPSYPSGQTVTLTATPASCYLFSSWSGDASGSTNPLTITMNANKNITANFVSNPQCAGTDPVWPSQVTGTGQNMKLEGNFELTGSGDKSRTISMTLSQGSAGYNTTLKPAYLKLESGWTGGATYLELKDGAFSCYYGSSLSTRRTDVSYNGIITKGKVTCSELVVTANPVFPDYVFAKDYKLPSLKETKKYIEKNGRLPGMVSATEVQKNGLSVGAMQTKLLEKIEEMTLHMIQMQEKMDKMQNRINELEAGKK